MCEKEMVRHFLATIHYRGMKYLSISDDAFNSYLPGNEIRTPAQILNHINGLMLYISSFFIDVQNTFPEEKTFSEEVKRFCQYLKELDNNISSYNLNPKMTYKQILQGPLADIMLHIGELSMQRKCSGKPADDLENYINADIKVGHYT
jgi:hypothetical protein